MDIEGIPARYSDVQAAVTDLAQLSRMLEIVRGCQARVDQMHRDLNGLADKLVRDRKAALQAIDAMTETAPASCGVEVSPYIDQSGAAFERELSSLEREAAEIVTAAGGL